MALYKPVDYIVALVILFVLLSLTKKILEEIEIDRNFCRDMICRILKGDNVLNSLFLELKFYI